MRILYLIDRLILGGKERQLVELLKGVTNNKDIKAEVCVMNKLDGGEAELIGSLDKTSQNKWVYCPELEGLNIKINYLLRLSKRDLSVFFKLFYLCKKLKPDIIHAWDSMTVIYALPVAKLLGIRLINGSIRNSTHPTPYTISWINSKLEFSVYDKVISNSFAALKNLKIPKNKGHVIYNGFDFNRIAKLRPVEEVKDSLGIKKEIVIGMVASFTIKKDWENFLLCAEIVLKKRKDVIFIAVGMLGRNKKIYDKIQSSVNPDIKRKIIFLTQYNPAEEVINIFDIGVLLTNTTYHQEGCSNAIMEYMALGKPVIANDSGGNNELIKHRKTGYIIYGNLHEKLSEKVLHLLENPGIKNSLGISGKKRIEEFFNLDKMTNAYFTLYKEMI